MLLQHINELLSPHVINFRYQIHASLIAISLSLIAGSSNDQCFNHAKIITSVDRHDSFMEGCMTKLVLYLQVLLYR